MTVAVFSVPARYAPNSSVSLIDCRRQQIRLGAKRPQPHERLSLFGERAPPARAALIRMHKREMRGYRP
jgi:hypothetical protein